MMMATDGPVVSGPPYTVVEVDGAPNDRTCRMPRRTHSDPGQRWTRIRAPADHAGVNSTAGLQ
jgi:hypothetical protein